MGAMTSRSRVRTARLVLGGIAVVYLVAFVSLAVQIDGLYGSRGILPVGDYLQWIHERAGADAWRVHPTLFWLSSSDLALKACCWAGAGSAAALLFGFAPPLSAICCWVLYFSLFQVGRVFLGFQWDILLLEAGFLAIFLAPLRWRSHVEFDPEPPVVVIWMFRWLLFRLMFSSGMVKLLSDDPTWWGLTALQYHYWTQPLPTFPAWFAAKLPQWFQEFSCLLMFVIELGVPWFVFGPRLLRLSAFVALVFLQLLIGWT
ncbi:MAG TPA: lipase maturation factor family protein, partial [Candidatus Binatia bacterium]